MQKFVIVTAPKLENVYHINFDTIAEFKDISEYATPPAVVNIENYSFFNAEDSRKLFKWFTFGTIINGVRASNILPFWRYDYQSQPPQAFFKFCKANHISTTNKNGKLYKESILNKLIDIFNKKQIERVYNHNTQEYDENLQTFAEFQNIPQLKFFYQPYKGIDFAIYQNKLEQLQQATNRPTEEEEKTIVNLAKAFSIEVEVEHTINHIHKINYETITDNGEYITKEYWREYTTIETYAPIPQYSYQGKKANGTTHYKSRLKTQYNTDSLNRAKKQIEFFQTLPIETQAEFLADNYKICTHCKTPYNVYNGCNCGHTPPEETPVYLQYIENINY